MKQGIRAVLAVTVLAAALASFAAAQPAKPATPEAAKPPATEPAKPAATDPTKPTGPGAPIPAKTPLLQEMEATHDQRMKWWRAARFGMFIHWGVYAVPAGVWNGQEVKRSGAEWIMNRGKIPVAEYRKLPAQFNPVKFDADAWVKLAKDAGMKYIVVTAKHHDGFAMFQSKVDGFNIHDATPFKRDPLKELAAASKKAGIKLGFYYSQAQDWSHPGGAAGGGYWDPQVQKGNMDDYIDKVAVPQVKELLTNYGPVAVLWWDTPIDMNPTRSEKFLPLLKLQPNIVMNDRLYRAPRAVGGRPFGDFKTPEQRIPSDGLPDQDWETCMTINKTWGFRASDNEWKTSETLVRNLVDIASKGGNYLLNVGPTREGVIPEPSVTRLEAIGAWMKVNGDAIYGTTASPFKQPLPFGRATQKADPSGKGVTLFLHVFEWPRDRKLSVPGLRNKVSSATLMAGHRKLPVKRDESGTLLTLPAAAPDPISTTIVLKLDGPVELS
jgi:alpha-L-fucosidase